MELVSDRCSCCPGPFHPASGHAWSERVKVCGPCIRSFMAWLRNRPGPSGGKLKPRKAPTEKQKANPIAGVGPLPD